MDEPNWFKSQKAICEKIRLKAYKRSLEVVGRSSPMSLYNITLKRHNDFSRFERTWSIDFIENGAMPRIVVGPRRRLTDQN